MREIRKNRLYTLVVGKNLCQYTIQPISPTGKCGRHCHVIQGAARARTERAFKSIKFCACLLLAKNAQVVVVKEGTAYTSTADLAGKTVVAEAGSAGEAAIQGDENLAKADYISKSVQTDCLMEVAAGTADAAVLDLTLANAMIGEGTDYASLKIVDELNAEEYGVAFRKGSDAAAAVDAAFDELKADGTMQALAEKYELALAD